MGKKAKGRNVKQTVEDYKRELIALERELPGMRQVVRASEPPRTLSLSDHRLVGDTNYHNKVQRLVDAQTRVSDLREILRLARLSDEETS